MTVSGTTFSQNGVEVRKVGGTIYQALTGNPADYATGWAALEDGTGRGVTVGLRWMAGFWPAGFELSGDGTARVELFSKRNSKTSIKFAWGAYETRELFFDFHGTTPASRNTALYEMQYPLGGRAPGLERTMTTPQAAAAAAAAPDGINYVALAVWDTSGQLVRLGVYEPEDADAAVERLRALGP